MARVWGWKRKKVERSRWGRENASKIQAALCGICLAKRKGIKEKGIEGGGWRKMGNRGRGWCAVTVGSGEGGKEELRHDVDALDKGTMEKKQKQPASSAGVYYFPG